MKFIKNNYPLNYKSDQSLSPKQIREIEKKYLDKPSAETQLWFPNPQQNSVNLKSRIKVEDIQITQQYEHALEQYLNEAIESSMAFTGEARSCEGFTVALSGGIDSAVCARLLQRYCQKQDKILKIIIMGCDYHTKEIEDYEGKPAEWIDIQYAKKMCKDLGLEYTFFDIGQDYKTQCSHYDRLQKLNPNFQADWVKSGLLPRIRANHLYTFAEANNQISVGSTNGSEFILSAFSVGGPAGQIAPLIDLYKSEVYAVARDIDVPQYIIDRKPLISELNLADNSLYGEAEGVDCTIMDPILRRLWFLKQTPEQVAEELGHSLQWIKDIYDKRIIGESFRRGFKPFTINRGFSSSAQPDLKIDRSYFV